MLVENLHEETQGLEYRLLVNKYGSRVMERIIPFSTPAQIRSLMARLQNKLSPLFIDRNASHVIQGLLAQVPSLLIDERKNAPETPPASMVDIFTAWCAELEPNWLNLSCSQFGSFQVRSILSILSGETQILKSYEKKAEWNKKNSGQTPVQKKVCLSSLFSLSLLRISPSLLLLLPVFSLPLISLAPLFPPLTPTPHTVYNRKKSLEST